MASYELITAQAALAARAAELGRAEIIALDTEASSFHRFKEQVCLVQLSTRDRTFLVDPLALPDLQPLGQLLSDKAMEVVIHDADYDLRILAKYHGIRVENVFDTLVAAELINEPEIGLASLLKKYQGVQVDKKFQKADWSKRPLPGDMLSYAAGDTSHLIALRDILKEKLIAKNRWDWAVEEFGLLTDAPFNLSLDDEPGFLRIKTAKLLKPQQLAILRDVHALRERIAERMDRAPFMVMGNEALLALATDPPKSMKELSARKGIGDRLLQRHGKDLLEVVKHAQELPKDQWPQVPRGKRWPSDPDYDERLKRLKMVRDRLTQDHDLRMGIVASNQMLADIARTLPGDIAALAAVPGMRRYQVQHFGSDLLKAL